MANSSGTLRLSLSSALRAKALSVKSSSKESEHYSRRGLGMVQKATGRRVIKRVPFKELSEQAAGSMRSVGSPHPKKQRLVAEWRHDEEAAVSIPSVGSPHPKKQRLAAERRHDDSPHPKKQRLAAERRYDEQAAVSIPSGASPHARRQMLAAGQRHALEIAPKPGSILGMRTYSYKFFCQLRTGHGDLVRVGAYDDTSSSHPYEDFCTVFDTTGGTCMIVCDGVSGARSVDTPYFVRALCEGLDASLREMSINNQSDFKRVIRLALHHVIDDICPSNERQTASATCSILFKHAISNRLFSAMIGDSGFKIVRDDQVIVDESSGGCESPLTDDNLMFDILSGINLTQLIPIPSQLVARHSCYGENKEPLDNIRFGEFSLEDRDRVILASDGVWDNMDGTGCIETSPRQASYMQSYKDFWTKTFERIESDPGTGDLNATNYFGNKARILAELDGYLALQAHIKNDDTTYVTLTVGGAKHYPGEPLDIFPGDDDWETAVVNRLEALEALYPSQVEEYGALSMGDFQQAQTQIVNPDFLFCKESLR